MRAGHLKHVPVKRAAGRLLSGQAEAAVWPRGWAHGRARAPPDVLPPMALIHHAAGKKSRRPPPASSLPEKTQCHLRCRERVLKDSLAVTKKHAIKSEFGVKRRLIDTSHTCYHGLHCDPHPPKEDVLKS